MTNFHNFKVCWVVFLRNNLFQVRQKRLQMWKLCLVNNQVVYCITVPGLISINDVKKAVDLYFDGGVGWTATFMTKKWYVGYTWKYYTWSSNLAATVIKPNMICLQNEKPPLFQISWEVEKLLPCSIRTWTCLLSNWIYNNPESDRSLTRSHYDIVFFT